MRYYIIAGEASGDLHASNLMKGLYLVDNDAAIRFRGGENMLKVFSQQRSCPGSDEGMAQDYRSGAVMGAVEILVKAGSLLRSLENCKADIAAFNPDVVILVDYPGFNLKIAEWAHKKGLKVFYYIAPKVWASREWRIKKIKAFVDRMFIVFPFEKEYFDSKELPYIYCGNPLVDAVEQSAAMHCDKTELKRNLGYDAATPVIALLAGSRLSEVKTMMPMFREIAASMHSDPKFAAYKFAIAGAPGRKTEDYGDFDRSYIDLKFGATQEIVRVADAAVINSGTASLEAALLGTVQVVAYKFPFSLTYYLAKWFFFKAKYISLGNYCLDKMVFKEFYRKEDCNCATVKAELERLLTDVPYREAMLKDYAAIRESLGGAGASERVAREMVRLLGEGQ